MVKPIMDAKPGHTGKGISNRIVKQLIQVNDGLPIETASVKQILLIDYRIETLCRIIQKPVTEGLQG